MLLLWTSFFYIVYEQMSTVDYVMQTVVAVHWA
jgi:hypothetical protein